MSEMPPQFACDVNSTVSLQVSQRVSTKTSVRVSTRTKDDENLSASAKHEFDQASDLRSTAIAHSHRLAAVEQQLAAQVAEQLPEDGQIPGKADERVTLPTARAMRLLVEEVRTQVLVDFQHVFGEIRRGLGASEVMTSAAMSLATKSSEAVAADRVKRDAKDEDFEDRLKALEKSCEAFANHFGNEDLQAKACEAADVSLEAVRAELCSAQSSMEMQVAEHAEAVRELHCRFADCATVAQMSDAVGSERALREEAVAAGAAASLEALACERESVDVVEARVEQVWNDVSASLHTTRAAFEDEMRVLKASVGGMGISVKDLSTCLADLSCKLQSWNLGSAVPSGEACQQRSSAVFSAHASSWQPLGRLPLAEGPPPPHPSPVAVFSARGRSRDRH